MTIVQGMLDLHFTYCSDFLAACSFKKLPGRLNKFKANLIIDFINSFYADSCNLMFFTIFGRREKCLIKQSKGYL